MFAASTSTIDSAIWQLSHARAFYGPAVLCLPELPIPSCTAPPATVNECVYAGKNCAFSLQNGYKSEIQHYW